MGRTTRSSTRTKRTRGGDTVDVDTSSSKENVDDANFQADASKTAMVMKFAKQAHVSGEVALCCLKASKWKFKAAMKLRATEQQVEQIVAQGLSGRMNESKHGQFVRHLQAFCKEQLLQPLPTIVVIGSESSGKSSVLERVAMQPVFPRDREICTRMPIKLVLKRDTSLDATGTATVAFRDDVRTVPHEELHIVVGSLMRDAVAALNGAVQGIISEELVVTISRPDVPNLEMIDLPGIVSASLPGEPENMMKLTRALAEKYVKRPDTLIICVTPATIRRVRDSQAMQIVQKHKAEARTLGVLTMCDLVHDPVVKDPRWELKQRVLGVAKDLVHLPFGYIAVKNRDSRLNVDIRQSAVEELLWFRKHLPEFSLTKQVSTAALIGAVDDAMTTHIRRVWVPSAIKQLQAAETASLAKLTALGSDPVETSLSDVMTRITGRLRGLITSWMQDGVRQVAKSCFPWRSVCSGTPLESAEFQAGVRKNLSENVVRFYSKSCIAVKDLIMRAVAEDVALPLKIARFSRLGTVLVDVAGADANTKCALVEVCEAHVHMCLGLRLATGAVADPSTGLCSHFARVVILPLLTMLSDPTAAEVVLQTAAVRRYGDASVLLLEDSGERTSVQAKIISQREAVEMLRKL